MKAVPEFGFTLYFIINLPSTLKSPMWSHPFSFSHLFRVCHMPRIISTSFTLTPKVNGQRIITRKSLRRVGFTNVLAAVVQSGQWRATGRTIGGSLPCHQAQTDSRIQAGCIMGNGAPPPELMWLRAGWRDRNINLHPVQRLRMRKPIPPLHAFSWRDP
jgi:hypothetical protein